MIVVRAFIVGQVGVSVKAVGMASGVGGGVGAGVADVLGRLCWQATAVGSKVTVAVAAMKVRRRMAAPLLRWNGNRLLSMVVAR